MAIEKWTDKRFGKRVKAKRDARGWSQAEMATMLTDMGAHMHATTVAKIEAGDRSVRINEASAIADLFEVSVDSLLNRKPGAQRSELTYLLRALRQSAQQAWGDLEAVRELLEELPAEFEGADGPQTLSNAWGMYLAPASESLTRLTIASEFLLSREEGAPELSEEATDGLGGARG
jgi:transcriptional regulator with XRE-family HTH domain